MQASITPGRGPRPSFSSLALQECGCPVLREASFAEPGSPNDRRFCGCWVEERRAGKLTIRSGRIVHIIGECRIGVKISFARSARNNIVPTSTIPALCATKTVTHTPTTATPSPHERQKRAFVGTPIRRLLGTPGAKERDSPQDRSDQELETKAGPPVHLSLEGKTTAFSHSKGAAPVATSRAASRPVRPRRSATARWRVGRRLSLPSSTARAPLSGPRSASPGRAVRTGC
jgi:hypothetical protein